MNIQLLFTILLGGVAALDATPIAQTLLSQPLVTATLLGWVWGDWKTALEVGIVLQVFAASTMPVGARTPEDYAVGGVVGAGTALALASQQSFEFERQSAVLGGIVLGMAVATVGVRLLKWQRRRNESLSRWCESELRRGNEGALTSSHLAAVTLAFGVGLAFTAAGLAVGILGLSDLVSRESLWLSKTWRLVQPILLGLGLAQLLNVFVQRRLTRAAVFGFSLVGAWLVLMLGVP